MKAKILSYLKQIEEEKAIKILWACETGSRAWGFPSPDSDYDVRLVYVHKKDWYLSVHDQKDFIERMFENKELDITGWELKKSLRLLKKSNASFLERIQSPIVYAMDEGFRTDILPVAQACYSRITTIHHYLSMAKKILAEISGGEDFKLKKFFYALRCATVCKWILEKEEIPPIEFRRVYTRLNINQKRQDRIEELIALKATMPESYLHTGEQDLLDFINECIELAEEKKHTLPAGNGRMDALNEILRQYVTQYDH